MPQGETSGAVPTWAFKLVTAYPVYSCEACGLAPHRSTPISKSTLVDQMALTNADRTSVANATVTAFDAVNRASPNSKATQVLALAAAFLILCEVHEVPAGEAFVAVKNLMYDRMHSERLEHRFSAMKHYVSTEGVR